MEHNAYLVDHGGDRSKGGGRFIEDPRTVENIVFQTRAGPLGPFEQRLADDLMQVFGDGHEALPDVVAGLNARGSADQAGAAWTEASFTDQMARSAAALFAPVDGEGRG